MIERSFAVSKDIHRHSCTYDDNFVLNIASGSGPLHLSFLSVLIRSIGSCIIPCSLTDWATDPDDRRSTSGFTIFLGDNLVAWQCKKQRTISRSSSKIAYQSLASTLIQFFVYFTREKVLQQIVHIKHVLAIDQLTDGLTKVISSQRFSLFRSKLTIQDLTAATDDSNCNFKGLC
uniref:Uncharacterized protein n=1 Tax=Cannabis sativa TaxID=3483 RepID=A0A803QKP9_CANSA